MKKKQIEIPRLSPGIELIDTHCHLDMNAYWDVIPDILSQSMKNGVTKIITIGIDLESSHKAIELARNFPGVWATIGVHPHNAAVENSQEIYLQLERLALEKANKVVGYGEVGLDYAKNYAPHDLQVDCFQKQLKIAKKLNLPIIIHDRDAHEETLDLLKAHTPFPAGGVMHCFSGDIHFARDIVDLGLYISIPGIVTFKNSGDMQQVARAIPLERIILETDGPFLAPVPFRGKVNQPEYLLFTAQKIADLRKISLDEVARETTKNAIRLFRLDQGDTEA